MERVRCVDDAGGMTCKFAANWFHPNDHGYRLWVDTFWAVIRAAGLFAALFTKEASCHQGLLALTVPRSTQ